MAYYKDGYRVVYNKSSLDMSEIPDESIQCVVTSPPYWGLRKYAGDQDIIWDARQGCQHEWKIEKISLLHENRNFHTGTQEEVLSSGYGLAHTHKTSELKAGFCRLCGAWKGGFGLELTVELYIKHSIQFLKEIWRVLRKDGIVFWNIGDSYAGGGSPGGDYRDKDRGDDYLRPYNRKGSNLKPKDLCLIPFRFAIAAQEQGWWIRSDIIWNKPNPMPESCKDRPTDCYEHIFMLTKSSKYYFDHEAVREEYSPTVRWGGNKYNGAVKAYWNKEDSGLARERDCYPNSGRNIRNVWTIPTQSFNGYVASYGKYRIVSPDCPIHGYQADRSPFQLYDEQLASFEIDHNLGMNKNPGELQEFSVVSIPLNLSSLPSDEISAILRSSKNYKKVNELRQDVIFYDIPDGHNEYTSLVFHSASKFSHKNENNTLAGFLKDEKGNCPLGQTFYHIFGILTFNPPDNNCYCYYTGKVVKRQDHFAVFPEAIPEKCIKMATPEYGCCSVCGKPYERIVENKPMVIRRTDWGDRAGNRTASSGTMLKPNETKTLGWQQDCKCENSKPVPSTVLDPFAGSGTTLEVAARLGRKSIGYEISKEYCDLIVERNKQGVLVASTG